MIRFAAFLVIGLSGFVAAPPSAAQAEQTSVYDFTLPAIDGGALPLAAYRGRPILLVNTASRCGFTGQYAGLQELWSRYREQGLVVIGAPSGDFRQELKSSAAVKAFCETTFGLDFPMSDIISVRGAAAHPLFAWIARHSQAPRWNFTKYLIDGSGAVVHRYPSSTKPRRIAQDIETLLPGPVE